MRKKYTAPEINGIKLEVPFYRRSSKTNQNNEISEGCATTVDCKFFNEYFATTLIGNEKRLQLVIAHDENHFIVPVTCPNGKFIYISKNDYERYLSYYFGSLDSLIPFGNQYKYKFSVTSIIIDGQTNLLLKYEEKDAYVRDARRRMNLKKYQKYLKESSSTFNNSDEFIYQYFGKVVKMTKPSHDHIMPLTKCFELGWTIKKATDYINLRLMDLSLNIRKNNRTDEEFLVILRNDPDFMKYINEL